MFAPHRRLPSRTADLRNRSAAKCVHGMEKSANLQFRFLLVPNVRAYPNDLGKTRGRQMGGIGSGRWVRENTKHVVEEVCTLDVNKLVRCNLLTPGASGIINWSVREKVIGSVSFAVLGEEFHDLVLWIKYRWNRSIMVSTEIHLQSTVPHFQGVRRWFRCPMSSGRGKCWRRVAHLYLVEGAFGCRQCHNLTYRSCQQSHQLRRFTDRIAQLTGLPAQPDGDFFQLTTAKHRNGRRTAVNP